MHRALVVEDTSPESEMDPEAQTEQFLEFLNSSRSRGSRSRPFKLG